MPLQFLHSLRLPFLGIVTINPSFKSLGTSSLTQISLGSPCRMSAVALVFTFSTSGEMLSFPGALPSFNFLMTLFISSFDIRSQLMLRSCLASSMSWGPSGAGLFRASSKFSFQRFSCWDSIVTGRLKLLFSPAGWLRYFLRLLSIVLSCCCLCFFSELLRLCFFVPLAALSNHSVLLLVFLSKAFLLVAVCLPVKFQFDVLSILQSPSMLHQ